MYCRSSLQKSPKRMPWFHECKHTMVVAHSEVTVNINPITVATMEKKKYIYVYNYIVHGGWLYSHGSFFSSLVKQCQTQSNHMVCSFVGYHRDFPAARLLSLRQLSLNLVGYLCIAEHFFWDKPWSKRGMIMGIQFITIPYQMNS